MDSGIRDSEDSSFPGDPYFAVDTSWASFVTNPDNWVSSGLHESEFKAWADKAKAKRLDPSTPNAWSASDKQEAWYLLPAAMRRSLTLFNDKIVSKNWFASVEQWDPLKNWSIRLLETEHKVG